MEHKQTLWNILIIIFVGKNWQIVKCKNVDMWSKIYILLSLLFWYRDRFVPNRAKNVKLNVCWTIGHDVPMMVDLYSCNDERRH